MKKNLKNIYNDVNDFFSSPPSSNQKAWGIINDFYHMILTYMEEKKISQADLAKKLGRSRSAISQMFNKTPNITVKKMVDISDAIGLSIKITSSEVPMEFGKFKELHQKYIFMPVNLFQQDKFQISSSEKKDEYTTNLETSFSIPYSNKFRETLYN